MAMSYLAATNSTSRPTPRPVSVSALPRRHRLLSDAPVFRPSATELFQSLLPDRGTLCRWTSRRRRHCLFFGNVYKRIPSIVPFSNSLWWRRYFRHYNRPFYLPRSNFFIHSYILSDVYCLPTEKKNLWVKITDVWPAMIRQQSYSEQKIMSWRLGKLVAVPARNLMQCSDTSRKIHHKTTQNTTWTQNFYQHSFYHFVNSACNWRAIHYSHVQG